MLKITMKDGAVREAEAGISIQDFVKQVSNSLAKKVLAAKVDGETKDLTTVLDKDCKVEFLTFDESFVYQAMHCGQPIIKSHHKSVRRVNYSLYHCLTK